jgi:lambda family phage minor tail protein L
VSVPVSDLQAIAPSAVIELFTLDLTTALHGVTETYRFHAGTSLNANGELVWNGNAYQRFPIEADGFEYTGQGQLPRPKLRVSNIMGTITAILLGLPDGLEGATVTRIRTLARYLDAVNFPGGTNPYGAPDPTAEFPREIYYIDRKSAENRDVVEFELAAAFDLTGVRAPKRQCIANICQWVYRSAECSYTAAGYYDANNTPVASAGLDVCGKRLSSCEARFNLFTRTGSVTVGSNVLTVNSTSQIVVGDPVRGWGLPAGTTVTEILSATTVRVSANAAASTSVTVTGTPSATAATMTVSSASGLAVGHSGSGTDINGASIIGISGTTLTLSARPYSFSRSGTYDQIYLARDAVRLSNTSSISVGMRVFGSLGINTTVFSVTTNTRIVLTAEPSPSPSEGAAVTVFFMPASPGSATYTFTANQTYSFRDPNAVLPFGSFPGVGTYSA